MAVEYEIASDIAVISEVANTNQLAHVVKMYNGAVTYDDEASSKYATVTIDGKSQRVMLCIAVNGNAVYDDVPCKYSTVDGHRCLNIVEPTGTEIIDDVPSVYETITVDGKNVRAIRCVLINQTPIYDGVSSVCTFVDNGKTHTAQLVNVVGSGAIEVIVKGVPPLVLVDAVASNIVSLIAYGGTYQSDTPTPSDPVDIVCNNGTLKVKDSELPVGYKRLVGISYDSNTYYETNEKLYGSDTLTITLSGTSSNGRNVIGAYSGTGDEARNFSLFIYGAGSTSNSYLRHGTQLGRPRYGTGVRTLVMGPSGTDGFLNDVTYDSETFETTDTFWIGALPNSSSTKFDGNIIGNITVSNRLKYIPCERVSDGEIGYYETFTGTFLENQGTGTPVIYSGYDTSHMTVVYVDTDTVETITITDENNTTIGTATCENLLGVGTYADQQEIISGHVTRNVGYIALTGAENWILSGGTGVWANFQSITGVAVGNASAVCSHSTYAGADVTVANLNQNEFSILTNGNITFKNANTTSTSNWTTFLANQQVAGTPVIIVYPLATPTTESVARQTMSVVEGDNTVDITQASMSGLELQVTYMGGVELTVEEVEDAQLSQDVEVTIQ